MLVILTICFMFFGHISLEVITLRKDGHVTCLLTEEDKHSALYLKTSAYATLRSNVSESIHWIHNDWFMDSLEDLSDDQQFTPITDSRWNELTLVNPKNYQPPEGKLHLSLSVCIEAHLNFTIILQSSSHVFEEIPINDSFMPKKSSGKCSWQHITIWQNERTLYITGLHQGPTQQYITEKYTWLRFKNFSEGLVKLHFYDFLWSDKVTTNASVFQIEASTQQQLCVNFYVSLDEGSELEITLMIDALDPIEKKIEGFNKLGELKTWKLIRLGPFDGRRGFVHLVRNKKEYSSGYWAIDHISYCQDKTVFATSVNHFDKSTICQTFEDIYHTVPRRCQTGFLGNNCNISCEEVLGKQFSYCQNHEICGTTIESCHCAPGYRGNSCEYGANNNYSITDSGEYNKTYVSHTMISESTQGSFLTKLEESANTGQSVIVDSTSDIPTRSDLRENSEAPMLTLTYANSFSTKVPTTLPVKEINLAGTKKMKTVLTGAVILVLLIFLGMILSCWLLRYHARERYNIGEPKVRVDHFDKYLEKSLAQGYLINQYNSLTNNPNKHRSVALYPKNIRRNYDNCNIPYDEDRIILQPMEDVGTNNYINASYIDGWGRRKAYIVTQGPKSTTAQDFWRMVWQRDVKTIIMATNFREHMQRKCFEYFPTYLNAILPITEFCIKLVKEEPFEFYNKRILEVYYKQYHKVVSHYQLKWNPDQDKPLYPNNLVPLVKIMNQNYSTDDWNSIVVHCSLGVGRSAILVLCDLALQMTKTGGFVDVYDLAKMLREQRPNMITSSDDYLLAHLVLSECLMEENMFTTGEEDTQEQLKYLNICSLHDSILHSQNLTAVEGYENEITFICSKQPKRGSVVRFWEKVILNKVKTVLFLNENGIKLWPLEIQLSERSICRIYHNSTCYYSFCTIYKLAIEEFDVRTTMLYKEEIIVLQLHDWHMSLQITSIEKLLLFENLSRTLDPLRKKTLVCCLNGISGCGLFVALSYIIRKYLREIHYDILNAVRSIRRSNEEFVSNSEELIFLREAVALYSQKFDPYQSVHTDL